MKNVDNWLSFKEGFMVECMLMAGDADIFTTIKFDFNLEQRSKLDQLLSAIDAYSNIYKQYENKSFDSIVEAVSKRSKVDIESIEEWFDELLICSLGDDGCADTIIGYRVLKNEKDRTEAMDFDSRPYKILHTVSPEFFKSWESNGIVSNKKKKSL